MARARGWVIGAWSMATLAALAGGCGRATHSEHFDRELDGDASGGSETTDRVTAGGNQQQVGGHDPGGDVSGAGAPGCVPGAPCACEEQLNGRTDCTPDSPSCSCPAIEACTPTTTTCFEPCGGDPTGNWVLEGGCFAGGALADCAGGWLEGTLAPSQMKLSFLEGGGLRGSGQEAWNLVAQVPVSCLGDAVSCDQGQLFTGPTGPLHHSSSRAWLATCRQNACGSCECAGENNERVPASSGWSVAGERLTLGPQLDFPYCVKGDVLWFGGATSAGEAKVSYKLRRQSCVGTPIACEERTQTSECIAERSCLWAGGACSGSAPSSCDFTSCGEVRGCALAPPVAPRCAGDAECPGLVTNGCHEPGCSAQTCIPVDADQVNCDVLETLDCAKAPGCSLNGAFCTGMTQCSAQTSDAVCNALNCHGGAYCVGTPERHCSALSVEACHEQKGCHIEW
jgi:hypothetical protein